MIEQNKRLMQFENYVNYAGSKTADAVAQSDTRFENYVNYAGSKTMVNVPFSSSCLRTM